MAMFRLLKNLLFWFLLAALPIQGMAAVTKAWCGGERHSSGMSHAVAASGADHAHHRHAAEHGAHHHAMSASADAMADQATDDAVASHHSAYCSACASCCVGAAVPSAAAALPAPRIDSQNVLLLPPARLASFIPSGLERPPKRFLA